MTGKSIINRSLEDCLSTSRIMGDSKQRYAFMLERVHMLVQSANKSRTSYSTVRTPRERIQAIHHMSSDLHETLSSLYNHWPIAVQNMPRIRVLTTATLRAFMEPMGDDILSICSATIRKLVAILPEKEYDEDDTMAEVFESEATHAPLGTDPTDQIDSS